MDLPRMQPTPGGFLMKEIWRGECSECEMAVEWVTFNIWMCGCPETGDETDGESE